MKREEKEEEKEKEKEEEEERAEVEVASEGYQRKIRQKHFPLLSPFFFSLIPLLLLLREKWENEK